MKVLSAMCGNCPFRAEGAIDLMPGRVAGIVADLARDDMRTFHCHKTTHGQKREVATCLGAMSYMHREGYSPVAMRLAVAINELSLQTVTDQYPLLIPEGLTLTASPTSTGRGRRGARRG